MDARSVDKPGDRPAKSPVPRGGESAAAAQATAAPAEALPADRAPLGWRDLWQAPTLAAAAVLLAGGIVAAFLTTPKPDLKAPLAQAAALLEEHNHTQALALLNERLLPHLGAEAFAPSRGEFHLLRARALYLGQRELGVSDPRNNANILSEYDAAEAHGAELSPQDEFQAADALVGQGEYDAAIERARAMPEGSRERRVEVLRRIVRQELAAGPGDPDGAMRLLGEFASEAGLSLDEQAWAEARQAELLLAQGKADEVMRRLLRAMPRVDGASGPLRGELHLLLGTAYLESALATGDLASMDRAQQQLTLSLEGLEPGDSMRALAHHRLGRVAEQTGDLASAREHYAAVVRDFAEEPVVWSSLLGLASVQATGGGEEGEVDEAEESLASFGRLVEHVRREGEDAVPGPEEVTDCLMARYQERFGEGDLELAIRYAELARDVSGLESAPSPVVKGLADANRRLAERLVREHGGGDAGAGDLRGVDPTARAAVRERFVAAGVYYRAHADRMVLEDNAAYADSLWLAGDSFDLGGDRDEAERAFRDYANGFQEDPRRAEAAFRVAQALQARGDLSAAAEFYRALIREADAGGEAGGPFGDRSYVPLAQTLLSDNDAENDAEAIGLLERVAAGALGGPPSPGFREALLELGRVHYKRREFAPAIERLSDAEAHFEGEAELAQVRFLLADAYRLSALQIEQDLAQGRPEHEKRALRQLRTERLTRAAELYEKAREAMEEAGEESLTPVERLCLRNAYLYLGDCAFDLGDYAGAILRYDAARDRYPRDAASLMALVQIVNAYLEQGDAERARTANERAKRFYESLPASVWDDPDLPMTNDEWAAWLESSAKLSRLAGAGAGKGENP